MTEQHEILRNINTPDICVINEPEHNTAHFTSLHYSTVVHVHISCILVSSLHSVLFVILWCRRGLLEFAYGAVHVASHCCTVVGAFRSVNASAPATASHLHNKSLIGYTFTASRAIE